MHILNFLVYFFMHFIQLSDDLSSLSGLKRKLKIDTQTIKILINCLMFYLIAKILII